MGPGLSEAVSDTLISRGGWGRPVSARWDWPWSVGIQGRGRGPGVERPGGGYTDHIAHTTPGRRQKAGKQGGVGLVLAG